MLRVTRYIVLLGVVIGVASFGLQNEHTTQTCAIESENYVVQAPGTDMTRFAVIGDYGHAGDNIQAVAELIQTWQPDFIITTGDNNYDLGLATTIDTNIGQYFHEYIGDYTGTFGVGSDENRFFPVLGNHDWGLALGEALPYLSYFTLPGNERYYTFKNGITQFFMLDSDMHEPDGVGKQSVQRKWLEAALAESTAVFKVVVFHHPSYSSGQHGSSDWMQWPYAEWGIDLVLNGHDHMYERIERDGLTYIVNGAGGHSLYSFSDPVDGSVVRYNCNFGAMVVDVLEGQLTSRFVTIGGGLVDTFSLIADE